MPGMRTIYLDNAATTKMSSEVIESMLPYFAENYGNPSAIYSLGSSGKSAINRARGVIAEAIGAKREEIYFTGGGSESDNWAIKMVAENYAHKGKHLITTRIEHHAVLHTCAYLEGQGYRVTYLDVDEDGMVSPEAVKEAIRKDTILISIMFANNEVGTLEPISEIGRIARDAGVLFHTDAVQAFGQVPIDVEDMCIDLLSASAHKIHGPKGVGMLYVRTGVAMGSFLHGGSQERGRRAGTENVPGIVGFGTAVKLACSDMEEKARYKEQMRDYLITGLEKEIPDTKLNGHRTQRLPGNVNMMFGGIEGESALIMLDMRGICASGGSACTSGSLDPSHVLIAMGRNSSEARGSIRFTLSGETTAEELDVVIEAMAGIVKRLRETLDFGVEKA